MNNKNDGSNKDTPRGTDPAGAKRPHAVLDLKATEVERKDTKPETPAASQPAAATAAKPTESAAKPTEPAAPASKPSDPLAAAAAKTTDAKPAETKAETPKPNIKYGQNGKPEAGKTTGAASPGLKSQGFEQQQKTKPAASTGTFVGSLLSHVTAGALGALLALVGAETFAPQLAQTFRLPNPAQTNEVVTKLQERLAALEKKGPGEAAPNQDLQKRIAELEARTQKIDSLTASVNTLSQSNARLAADVADAKVVASKIANSGAGPSDAADRIAQLEKQLAGLAAAATAEPDKAGRIPQLAAITGRLDGFEAKLQDQIGQVRASIPQEVDKGLSRTAAASEATTGRIDRDLGGVKSDIGGLKQLVRAAQDDITGAKGALDALKADVENKLKATAKSADVSAAVAPVTTKLDAVEKKLDGVVRSEEDRKVNAERIVVSLELANLKRVLDRGQPYATELAEVGKAAAGKVDLAPLERYKNDGVPTITDLAAEFRDVAYATIDADAEPANATIMDRLLSGAKSVIRVRKVNHGSDDKSTEAIVGRMEDALKDGRLGDVLAGAKQVPQKASAPLQGWLAKVEARNSVDRAIASIEGQLKASLSGAPATKASN